MKVQVMSISQSLDLPVAGMSCASCAGRVEKALRALPNVTSASVNLASESAHVVFEGVAAPAAAVQAVEKAGYAVPQERFHLAIEGMSCASCVGRVEKALQAVPGVAQASVNLAGESAEVVAPRGSLDTASLIEAVRKAGYAARPFEDSATDASSAIAQRSAETARHLARERHLALLTLALAAPFIGGMIASLLGRHDLMLSPLLQFLIATPVQFVLGWRFYRAGWSALRAGTGNMDLLVALGTTAAWGLSTWLWATATHHAPHLYYEGSVAIIAFVRLGKWLEARARGQTAAALKALLQLRPATARRRRADGSEETVDTVLLQPGDILLLRAGEAFAADGIVIEGHGSVDEAMLTGESLPIEKQPKDVVRAGTINRDGWLAVRIEATAGETMLARILRLVDSAQASKPPVQQLVDRISGVFVPVVLFIALVTFALTLTLGGIGSNGGNVETALLHAIAVLVIACPCALGLATPAALMVGTGVAARHGILIRDSAALEKARNLRLVAFDKTGTLTEGKPVVAALHAVDGDEAALLRYAAALQAGSQHPLAEAVRSAVRTRAGDIALPPVQEFRDFAGRGVCGTVEGRHLLLGNARLLLEHGIDAAPLRAVADDQTALGRTVSWLADDSSKQLLGLFAFGDEPKATSAAAVARLKQMNLRVAMLSGDSVAAASAVAARLGIDEVRAGLLPEDKAKVLAQLKELAGGDIAMVGDGVNDAPALAAADLGIAMGSGTDAAMQTAGVTLMRGDPLLVADAIEIARATDARIRQNLGWAFAYNVVGIPLAAFGLLDPVLAGAAMALSSVSVLTNALLLRRWKPTKGSQEVQP